MTELDWVDAKDVDYASRQRALNVAIDAALASLARDGYLIRDDSNVCEILERALDDLADQVPDVVN